MIERKFVKDNIKELQIKEHIISKLSRAGLSSVEVKRTPLGEKIVIKAARPGMVVGRGGSNINALTHDMKTVFRLNNPQIEIEELENPNLDPNVIAENIVSGLERFGTSRFKGLGHRAITDVMKAGALGVEILITGRIPSSRAKRWRFYQGYLKKCGDISLSGVNTAYKIAKLKSGAVGVQVRIMPATTKVPDRVTIADADVEEKTIPEKESTQVEDAAEKKANEAAKQLIKKSEEKKEEKESAKPAQKKSDKKESEKKAHKKTKKSSAKHTTKKSTAKTADKEAKKQ